MLPLLHLPCRFLTCALFAHFMMRLVDGMSTGSEENFPLDLEVDKRYIAALAKNGRLQQAKYQMDQRSSQDRVATPSDSMKATWVKKPSDSAEKDSLEPDEMDKRYVGAFLRSRGRPAFAPPGVDDDESKEKRNIGALARMGWLTTARSYRSPRTKLRPYVDPGVKREDLLYGDGPSGSSTNDDEEDCVEEDEQENSTEGSPIEKRNIAALARNGRLPPFRNNWDYWSLKRTPIIRYSHGSWPSAPVILNPQQFSNKKRQQHYGYMRFIKSNDVKRCRRPISNHEEKETKRNIAALARKGILPQRRNVAALARKGITVRGGVASMARKGLLGRFARQDMIKKNVASMARKGMLPNQS